MIAIITPSYVEQMEFMDIYEPHLRTREISYGKLDPKRKYTIWYKCKYEKEDDTINIAWLNGAYYGYDYYIYDLEHHFMHRLHPEKSHVASNISFDINMIKKRERDFMKLYRSPYIPDEIRTEEQFYKFLYMQRKSINIDMYNQDLYGYLPGLDYIYHKLKKYSSYRGIYIDLAIETTFGEGKGYFIKEGIIPYMHPWMGIVHHYPMQGIFSIKDIVDSKEFKDSLKSCLCLIVFSENIYKWLKEHINVKILKVQHPISFKCTGWQGKWEKLIQIGSWMKDINAIYDIKVSCKKAIRGKGRIERDDVEIIRPLNGEEYDRMLANNIIFMKIINGTVTNCILECIIRSTPIIVNRCETSIEMLGKDYPLLYDEYDQIEKLLSIIYDAHQYLHNIDKSIYRFSSFYEDLITF